VARRLEQPRDFQFERLQEGAGDALFLGEQRVQEVLVIQFGMPAPEGVLLGGLQGLLELLGESVESHRFRGRGGRVELALGLKCCMNPASAAGSRIRMGKLLEGSDVILIGVRIVGW
jgi:hypothetical protein